jgi:chromosome segregation ATPase
VLAQSSSLDQQTILELKAETKQLKGNVEELMAQLKRQDQNRDRNETLREENERLKKRLQDMEQAITQVIQANEGADRTDELMQEVTRLTFLLAEHQRTEAELCDTLSSVAELTQENKSLKQKYEDLKVEKKSLERELAEVGNYMQNLQGEKTSVMKRLADMEKLLADPQEPGSSRRELQMLLSDVTKENEDLKSREREMQQQMSTILLTSRDQAQMDDLKRENSRWKLHVEELEEVVRGLQASSSDNVLRKRISELDREKQALNAQVGEMARRVVGIEELSARRIEDLERRCRELEATNQTLRLRQTAGTNHDENMPPPAYEEISIGAL